MLNYNELDYKEKKYFNNDEILFLQKKKLLLENMNNIKLIKTLHLKLKNLPDGEEREDVAVEIVKKNSKLNKNYKEIDQWHNS